MGKPAVLNTDEEGGLQSKQVGEYLRKEGITYIINRNHAPFIERFVRAFRNMISRRLRKRPEEHWYNLIYETLLTYNRKMVSRVSGFTPADASKPENRAEVKENLERTAKREKQYEQMSFGDEVKLYRKRKHLSEKESMPIWSKQANAVIKIDENPNAGKLYYLSGQPDKPVLRSQILKVKE